MQSESKSRPKTKVGNNQNHNKAKHKENTRQTKRVALSQKVAAQPPKPNKMSTRHTEGENSTETDTKQARSENSIRSTALERLATKNTTGGLNRPNGILTSPSASVLVQSYTFINTKIMQIMFEDIKHKHNILNIYNGKQSEQLLK